MSRYKRKLDKKKRLPPFVAIFKEILESTAYQELPGSAAKAYPYFKDIDGRLTAKHGDDYDGTFDFTYSEAERIGFSRSTFSRIISKLHAYGFIDIVRQGGMRGCRMSNTKFRLSERWRNYGKQTFMATPRYLSEPPRQKNQGRI